MAAASRAEAIAGVQAIFDRYWLLVAKENFNGFDNQLMADVKIIDASIGPPSSSSPDQPLSPPAVISSATFSLIISPTYSNLNGVMHGGAAGVIFDMCTTSALGPVARPGYWDKPGSFLGGVTRSLNISYLKAVPVGTKVHLHSQVYQIGRTMAYIKGWMTSEDGKTVYCTCDHHKVGVPSRKAHMDVKVPWDEQFAGGNSNKPKI
ncbi:thioesterase family protein-like protein [Thozetella sp. PMI_491]|nr:thioesterase family protein-like protein [Thozetella sp. PMI_491]